MLKRLPVVLGLLLLAGCGLIGDGPLTRQEIAGLPDDVLTQRLVTQMGLTVSDVPIERNRTWQTFMHTRGYDYVDGLCRQDVLYVNFDRKTQPEGPVVARGFTSEATYASPKAQPVAGGCADPHLHFFRAESMRQTPHWMVARDGMALLLAARSSSQGAAMQCVPRRFKDHPDCKALLAAFPVGRISHVFDCETEEKGGKCASLFTDEWILTITSAADGRITSVEQKPNISL